MPASSIADQNGMRTGRHLRADFIEMLVHRLGVGGGHDDSSANGTGRTNRPKQISRIMPIIAHHQRARTDRRPDISQRSLLTHSGLVLEPDLDWCSGGGGEKSILHQAREV